MSAAIVAYGALSALGEGRHAFDAGSIGAPARVALATDEELVHAGLARPVCARVELGRAVEDRASFLLAGALAQCTRALDDARPGWRDARVGLCLGTSSGGMRSAERLFATIARGDAPTADLFARAQYAGPMLDALAPLAMRFSPASLVLAACASATVAIGLGARWLAEDACALVLAGGFDAVSVFVAAGFEALHATTASRPRPFRVGRDGMALGEGAAIVALVRPDDARGRAFGYVAGFGASADAVHLTAPDREGGGLARAALAALDDAGMVGARDVDLVSAHATATPFNDPAETRALERALGDARAHAVPVHPFKAQIGHTLGAAGALESLACLDAFARGVIPAAAGDGERDPQASVTLLDRAIAGEPRAALKLSSAFGGANAALVLTRDRPAPRRRALRDAFVSRAVHVAAPPPIADLAQRLGHPADRLARADLLTLLGLAALSDLAARVGPLDGAGIVVGSATCTIETNARFAARLRERGARFVEPRRFPYTSPNAVGGDCGVVFHLTGPAFTVGAGLHAAIEALAAAVTLVRAGDADRVVVLAVDESGDAIARCAAAGAAPPIVSGAAALVVSAASDAAVARVVATEVAFGAASEAAPVVATEVAPGEAATSGDPARSGPAAIGHAALLPLTGDACPTSLTAASSLAVGPAARARVALAPLPAGGAESRAARVSH